MTSVPACLAATEHRFYERTRPSNRADVRWPGGKPLAFAVLLCAEHYELIPREGAYAPVNVPGLFGRGPYPDVGSFARREYGNRVGFFRIARMLGDLELPATAAIDSGVATRCPTVLDEALRRGWAIAGHGRAVNDILSSRLSREQEREDIEYCLSTLRSAGAQHIRGWHGAEYGESALTPSLLVSAGLEYVLDWPHDEQPVSMQTESGSLLSLPVCADFDDVHAMWHRRIAPDRWVAAILDAVQVLAREGSKGGRMYVLNLHAWLSGQPFRSHALESLLRALRQRDDIWFATTDEIAIWARHGFSAAAGTPS